MNNGTLAFWPFNWPSIPAADARALLQAFTPIQRQHNELAAVYNSLLKEAVAIIGQLPPEKRDTRAADALRAASLSLLESDRRIRSLQVQIVAAGQQAVARGKLNPDDAPKLPTGMGIAPLVILAVGAVAIGAIVALGLLGIAAYQAIEAQRRANEREAASLAEVQRILAQYREQLASDPTTPLPGLPEVNQPAAGGLESLLDNVGLIVTVGGVLWVLSMLPKGSK